MDFIIALLVTVIILFFSSVVTFAADSDSSNGDNIKDVYVVQGKTTVIYKGQAADAEDTVPDNGNNAARSPAQEKNSFRNFKTDNNKNPVNIEADSMDYDNVQDVYHARGKVTIFYSGAALFADEVELDNKNNVATAQGNAFLKMGEDTLRGEKILFNIEDKTGAAYKANAFYARNNFYVKGDKIEKTGENTYYIEQPLATTCNGDDPDWQIAGSSMKVTIEGLGLMKDARFLAKGLPVFYTPYLPFPAKTKRQSGFLLPHLSYSRDKDGLDIEIPFFWAISPEMDATFYQRYIEKRGFKEGVEFRYYLGEKSFGTFYGDYLEDARHVIETTDASTSRDWQGTHKRWSYYFNHQTDFDSQFYVRTDLKKVSDKWYFKDFSAHNYYLDNYTETAGDNFKNIHFKGDESLRYLESSIRVYKGWSNFNVTGMINSTEDFAAVNNDHTLQRYPEIVLTGVKQQFLSTPLYYEFTGAYDYLYRGEGDTGHFIDFSPTISLPFDISRYLKVTPQFTLKETFWSRDDDQTDSREKTDTRTIYNASISLSSQLSRVFDVRMKNWEKIRHEIKPEISYSYVPGVSADDVPDYYSSVSSPFVMLDTNLSGDALTEQNAVAWALTNTLTAKTKDEAGKDGYLEFLRLKLFQTYDIHEARKDMDGSTSDRRPFSDMGLEFDFTPHKYFSFRARDKYNFYSGWKQNNYDVHIRDWRDDAFSVSYRNTEDSLEELNLNLNAVITKNINGIFISRYDLLNSKTKENSLGLIYHTQCWSVMLDYTKTDDDVRFMFKLSLAGFDKLNFK
ncbi:MAG: LPS assembly protein LptD [Deltaproteobacteria bacterium]|nr:LPS assembly protein LptD [Deltaproteobacteria bacterium]